MYVKLKFARFFKNPTQLMTGFFRKWESGGFENGLFDDFYMCYCQGIWDFLDQIRPALKQASRDAVRAHYAFEAFKQAVLERPKCTDRDHLDELYPGDPAKRKVLLEREEAALYFLPCLNFYLCFDCINVIRNLAMEPDMDMRHQASLDYFYVVSALSHRFITDYAACYNKDFNELAAIYNAVIDKYFKFRRQHSEAEIYNKALEDFFIADILERLLPTDCVLMKRFTLEDEFDKETKRLLHENLHAFFSRPAGKLARALGKHYKEFGQMRKALEGDWIDENLHLRKGAVSLSKAKSAGAGEFSLNSRPPLAWQMMNMPPDPEEYAKYRHLGYKDLKLPYPFEQHTPLRDLFYHNFKIWLVKDSGKSAFTSFYLDYAAVLLAFMGKNYAGADKTGPGINERYNKLMQTDEVLLYFLTCYHAILVRDYLLNAPCFAYATLKKFLSEDYHSVLVACRKCFLVTYASEYNITYEKLFAEDKARWKQYSTFFDIYWRAGREAELKAEGKKDPDFTDLRFPEADDKKVYGSMQDILRKGLMQNFLAPDDEETGKLISLNMSIYFDEMIPKILARARGIYTKLPELVKEIKS